MAQVGSPVQDHDGSPVEDQVGSPVQDQDAGGKDGDGASAPGGEEMN